MAVTPMIDFACPRLGRCGDSVVLGSLLSLTLVQLYQRKWEAATQSMLLTLQFDEKVTPLLLTLVAKQKEAERERERKDKQ